MVVVQKRPGPQQVSLVGDQATLQHLLDVISHRPMAVAVKRIHVLLKRKNYTAVVGTNFVFEVPFINLVPNCTDDPHHHFLVRQPTITTKLHKACQTIYL